MLRSCISLILALFFLQSYAGQLPVGDLLIENINVDKGLCQSQVNSICIDNENRVWCATIGGVSCYDGKRFTNYNMVNGLADNFCTRIAVDRQNRIWVSTEKGVSCIVNQRIYNYEFPAGINPGTVLLAVNGAAPLFICAEKVFVFNERSLVALPCKALANKTVVLARQLKDRIYVSTKDSMIMVFNSAMEFEYKTISDAVVIDYFEYQKQLYCATRSKIFKLELQSLTESTVLSPLIAQYHPYRILGSADHLYLLTEKGLADATCESNLYRGSNGLTDNNLNDLVLDHYQTLWVASDGDGLFSCRNALFLNLLQPYLKNIPGIMSIQRKDRALNLGSYNNGFMVLDESGLRSYQQSSNGEQIRFILSSCAYRDGILVGTRGNKLQYFHNGRLESFSENAKIKGKDIGDLFYDKVANNYWIASTRGFGYLHDGHYYEVNNQVFTWTIKRYKNDLLVAAGKGIYRLENGQLKAASKHPLIMKNAITCIEFTGDKIWLATTGSGVLIWDPVTDAVQDISSKNGLPDDFIYFIGQQSPSSFWIGSGKGVSQLNIKGKDTLIYNYAIPDGLLGPECNRSSFWLDNNGLFVGTTKGLFYKDITQADVPFTAPKAALHLYLNSNETIDTISLLQNSASVISLTYPVKINFTINAFNYPVAADLEYYYRISGEDTNWVSLNANNDAIISELSPGIYDLAVKCVDRKTKQVSNEIKCRLKVLPKFYQTLTFRLIILLLLVLTGILINYIIEKVKANEKRKIEAIKNEEQQKIKQQLALDFHDDIGNKTTRLKLLAQLLKGSAAGDANLINEMRQTAESIYSSAREIVSSLNESGQSLADFVNRNALFLEQTFQSTGIVLHNFTVVKSFEQVQLSLHLHRNLSMIIKEFATNTLKHAEANQFTAVIEVKDQVLRIELSDDGKGIAVVSQQKGHGLYNMKERARAIGAELTITTELPKGIHLLLTLPLTNEL